MGQHRRFLQLTNSQQTDRRTQLERKELKSLTKLVEAEQLKYREALAKFFYDHKDRFLIGFRSANHPANLFTSWSSSHQKFVNHRLKAETNLPLKFGKCRQILSFQQQRKIFLLGIDSLKFQVVHEEYSCSCQKDSSSTSLRAVEFPPNGSRVIPPNKGRVPVCTWLKDDTRAHELARQYNANIITTAETIEKLLLLPGEFDSRWIIFATSVENSTADREATKVDNNSCLTILDVPIAQSLLPRTCLEKGIQEGLEQQLLESSEESNPCPVKYVYTLWTLPATNHLSSRRKPVNVIIRSTIRLINSNNIPIRLRSRVEYFPERGTENPTLYEKALWILDQLLLEHKVKTCLGRINANTMTIHEWEDTSVAHAFEEAEDKSSNPLLHWQTVIQILRSIPTMDKNCLLCLPSQEGEGKNRANSKFSASIHTPEDGNSATDSLINLEPILEQADAVPLSAEKLQYCSCDWKWQINERIPYTFPRNPEERTKNS